MCCALIKWLNLCGVNARRRTGSMSDLVCTPPHRPLRTRIKQPCLELRQMAVYHRNKSSCVKKYARYLHKTTTVVFIICSAVKRAKFHLSTVIFTKVSFGNVIHLQPTMRMLSRIFEVGDPKCFEVSLSR